MKTVVRLFGNATIASIYSFLSLSFMAKAKKIIGWICTILIVLFMGPSLVMKFIATEGTEAATLMAGDGYWEFRQYLGALQAVTLILFLIPRTALVGYIMVIGYAAGALATVLTHGNFAAEGWPLVWALFFITVCGYTRFPELTQRLRGKM